MTDQRDKTDVEQLKDLLGVSVWDVRSFRADIAVDFDEHGTILSARLLNAEDRSSGEGSQQ